MCNIITFYNIQLQIFHLSSVSGKYCNTLPSDGHTEKFLCVPEYFLTFPAGSQASGRLKCKYVTVTEAQIYIFVPLKTKNSCLLLNKPDSLALDTEVH